MRNRSREPREYPYGGRSGPDHDHDHPHNGEHRHPFRAAFEHFRQHRHGGWGEGGGHFGERMRRGRMKYAVLAVLAETARHGYEILTEIENRRGNRPSAGAIYPVLQMLEDGGYVTSAEVDGKRVYSITDSGRTLLTEPGSADEPEDREPDARGRCRAAGMRLTATFAAMRAASDDELERVTEILDKARREIHRVLAGEDGA